MWEQVFKIALTQGIWAALFVALLIFVLRENNKREIRYIGIIETQTKEGATALTALTTEVRCVKENVDEIKEWLIVPKR
ncbi:MAG: BhlA/UviB family holin-like peptide [Thermodesulfobacteriota bacterium]|nr:BhlA/UviB family holin-like peptide [Thermodesulfobacteriota bacterium]